MTTCILLPGHASATTGTGSSNAVGYLQVFSATEPVKTGEDVYYFPHTGYRIYDTSGHLMKSVENRDSEVDEVPQTVELKPGTYSIWALSDSGHYVTMPVRIKSARTTTVSLENKS